MLFYIGMYKYKCAIESIHLKRNHLSGVKIETSAAEMNYFS
jgi:hypothetical protein